MEALWKKRALLQPEKKVPIAKALEKKVEVLGGIAQLLEGMMTALLKLMVEVEAQVPSTRGAMKMMMRMKVSFIINARVERANHLDTWWNLFECISWTQFVKAGLFEGLMRF